MRVMLRVVLGACGVMILAGSGYLLAAGPQAAGSAASAAPQHRALLNQYCVTCHNQRLETAGLVLEANTVDVSNLGAAPEVWEKVVQKLRTRAMPPAGLPRPDAAGYDSLAAYLEGELESRGRT